MKIKVENVVGNDPRIVPMSELAFGEIGEVNDKDHYFSGHYVVRCGKDLKNSIMVDLCEIGQGKHWLNDCNLKVRILNPGEKFTLAFEA